MKIAGPLFLLAVLVLMSPSAAAQDEEEISRLRSEVRQLRDLVKELTVDLVQVKARVRDLEKRLAEAEGGGDAVAEAAPGVPTEKDGGEETRNTAFAGIYRVDPAATQEEYIKWRLSELREEDREEARAGIAEEARDELGEFRIEMTLYSDGKVTVMAEIMETVTAITGRWSSDGNQVALTFTHEDGVEKEDPERAAGEVSDNLLLLKSEDMPFYLVLEKGNDSGVGDEEVPADDPLPEEGPDVAPPTPEAPGGTAGAYVLDKEKMLPVFEAMVLEQMESALEGVTEEERAAAIAQAKLQARGFLDRMNFEVLLSDDGSFSVTGEGVGAKGTWEVEGAKITFTTLMESGVEQDPPDVRTGRIVDGDIYFKPDEDMPFEMVLTRK